ncbi:MULTISPECIES: TerC family protein [unclassified Rummeliibacillus]|uniref:TerC family protein n=1 Tax=unclassified Rummeliibacillus TaxID=2622809 RepID=UPI000E6731D8|nr:MULTISPECIES: TerC family protein [unclassified Rummeliibacillus]RIJ64277.1 TerC family protein [Rummeliibacillus sp. POC4]RPJ94765.1 TerC family protein [Rummeliibacillus sp. TYF005]
MEAAFLAKIASIILLDIVLSGDNAVVIALACRNLAKEQRKKAILLGTGGAIGLRIVLTFVAVWLLQIPLVKVVGGLLLLYIAFDLLRSGDEDPDVKSGNNLFAAVRTIIVADFVMSLDNVLAIAGVANGHIGLVALGLLVSIPLIVFGSQIIIKLMEKFPILIWIGALLIAYTAGTMVVDDKYGHQLVEATFPMMEHLIPIISMVLLIIIGVWTKNRQVRNIRR